MKDKKIIFGITLAFIFIASVGFSYAYFSSAITNKDVKDQVVETGTLQLTYTDGPEINIQNMKPGNTINKTITVKNTGSLEAKYNIIWQELTNEITNDEVLIEGTCTRINVTTEEVDGTCENIVSTPINSLKIKRNISIEPNIIHKYDLTITFKDTNEAQNYNQGKKFSGVLGVENAPEVVNCTFDGEVTQGAEYVNGIYTYRYMQEKSDANVSTLTVNWKNMDVPGWGVALTNPSSTEDVSTKGVCTYINDVPVIYMGGMFALSQARNIDLSRLNTSNVVSMFAMLGYSNASSLDLSSFDTNKVTNMGGMFIGSKATTLDLSSFDTSNVTSMQGMFERSAVKNINLSNFDTSKVIDMSFVFNYSAATNIFGLENFDTSKVTNMEGMFQCTQVINLDLRNFNTSKVTNMSAMFNGYKATTLDVSNFDTSNVKSMSSMFWGVKTEKLDLSSFDTSKVTDMNNMFYNSKVKTIYVSNNFITANVTSSSDMFEGVTNLVGGNGTKYNSSYVDKTYARIDGGAELPGYFTKK